LNYILYGLDECLVEDWTAATAAIELFVDVWCQTFGYALVAFMAFIPRSQSSDG
jgi:hypothetical protein